MSVFTFIQLIVVGLAMGLVYVLLASGFNLIMTAPKILFIAYGEFYMLGAYVLWGLMILKGVPFFPALCAATLTTAILGGRNIQAYFPAYPTYGATVLTQHGSRSRFIDDNSTGSIVGFWNRGEGYAINISWHS